MSLLVLHQFTLYLSGECADITLVQFHLVSIPMKSLHVIHEFTFPPDGEEAKITLELLSVLSGCGMKLTLVLHQN